jgi:carotenoid cleavage dioxygenase
MNVALKTDKTKAKKGKADAEAPFGLNHGPMLTGTFAPVTSEIEVNDFEIVGEIPKDLNGVYLRNGPNPRFEPKDTYHIFDGDGMIHSAEFREGRMVYRNKWIRTASYLKNEQQGKETHWGVMSTVKDNKECPMADVANTDVIGHGGNAIVSWYLSGIPYLVDPITLDTIKSVPEYVSGPGKGMSAHCKVDEYTGDLMFFDYFTEKPHMSYGVVSAEGQLTHFVPIELPGDRLMHDMGITENYTILHDVPVYHDEEALKAGRHKIRFNSSLQTRFGVIPRFGASDTIKWFDFTPCFVYHVVNSWEEGDEVVMVLCRYMPAKDEDGNIDEGRTAQMIAQLKMDSRLWEYRMNMKTGESAERCLNPDRNVEFPGFNAQETGRFTQYGYLVDHDPEILRWKGLRKMNLQTGETLAAWSDDPDHCWYSEPWFAPADNPEKEDHGYVVIFCWNDKTEVQELQIFDGQNIGEGPVTRVILPRRVPSGFHGCWMKPNQIANWNR